jgi:hypothetical protein
MIRVQHEGKIWLVEASFEELRAGKPVSFNGTSYEVSEWLGKRAVRKWKPSESPEIPATAHFPTIWSPLKSYEIAMPVKGALASRLKDKRDLLVLVEMTDILNHSDQAFRQELIREAFHESEWNLVAVSAYQVVGVQPPDQVLIRFSFKTSTKL